MFSGLRGRTRITRQRQGALSIATDFTRRATGRGRPAVRIIGQSESGGIGGGLFSAGCGAVSFLVALYGLLWWVAMAFFGRCKCRNACDGVGVLRGGGLPALRPCGLRAGARAARLVRRMWATAARWSALEGLARGAERAGCLRACSAGFAGFQLVAFCASCLFRRACFVDL